MPRNPSPAYWEYLYISIAITAACAVVLLVIGSATGGLVLLAVTVAEVAGLVIYRRRAQRG